MSKNNESEPIKLSMSLKNKNKKWHCDVTKIGYFFDLSPLGFIDKKRNLSNFPNKKITYPSSQRNRGNAPFYWFE